MNYIVLDLEWNQSPLGKGSENKRIPFEIIEIGAVKCNEKKEVIGEFHEYVRPSVYRQLHHITRELLGIAFHDLDQYDRFPQVIQRFLKWCGTDYTFCTWGTMDLTELQKNMDYYELSHYFQHAIRYYDIQKLFSLTFEQQRVARNLEYAVNYLEIKKEYEFHTAINDARYTAKILYRLDDELIHRNYSIDCYMNPKNKKEEIYAIYDQYSKHITREFDSKELLMQDRVIRQTICPKCSKVAVKKLRWFSVNSKKYYCLAYCREHGLIKGKIQIKKTFADKYYGIKILKMIEENEASEIYIRKKEVQKKRREKRKRRLNELEH